MDMARTAVNVIGNCLACAVIARWEGELETSLGVSCFANLVRLYFDGGGNMRARHNCAYFGRLTERLPRRRSPFRA